MARDVRKGNGRNLGSSYHASGLRVPRDVPYSRYTIETIMRKFLMLILRPSEVLLSITNLHAPDNNGT